MSLKYVIQQWVDSNTLLLLVLFGVLGFFISGLLTYYYKENFIVWAIKKIRLNIAIKKSTNNSIPLMANNNIFPLAHGNPFWENTDILVETSTNTIIVGFPNSKRDEIKKLNIDFVCRNSTGLDYDSKLFLAMGIDNIKDRVERHSKLVADKIIKQGYSEHNREMNGIWDIRRLNEGENEYRKLKLISYRTDAFTNKVFASIYKELKAEGHAISQVKKIEKILVYKPFLSSFEIGNFILAKNHSPVILSKHLYLSHPIKLFLFPDDSQIPQSGYNNITGRPNLFSYYDKFLIDKLGIDPSHLKTNNYFLDLYFNRENFELGITSVIEIDQHLYSTLNLVPSSNNDENGLQIIDVNLKSINHFLRTEKMPASSELAFRMLLARVYNNDLPNGNRLKFKIKP